MLILHSQAAELTGKSPVDYVSAAAGKAPKNVAVAMLPYMRPPIARRQAR